jgi:alanyl-tRNA synthetase
VTTTKDIGAFAILSQEAVASGIKRITAITGPKIIEKLHHIEQILDQQVEALDIKSYAQIGEKTTKFLREYEEMKSKLESMETKMIQTTLQSAERKSNKDFETIIQVDSTTNFKIVGTIAKSLFSDKKTLLLFTEEGNYLILTNGSLSAKELAKKYNLKGGGSDTIAQGRDMTVVTIS